MNKTIRFAFLSFLGLFFSFLHSCDVAMAQASITFPAKKQLIYHGFDAPAAGHYAKHVELAKATPFSGFAIQLEASDEGRSAVEQNFPANEIWTSTPWMQSWFDESLEALREANARAPEHQNFLCVHSNVDSVDWMDDDGWKQVTDHFRIMAAAAKRSGCKGLLFDPEPYPHHAEVVPFAYDRQPKKSEYTFEQYYAKARQRGRESMTAMAAEYPDMTVFSLFFLSYLTVDMPHRGPDIASAENPAAALKLHTYNLLLPFFLGWLEAAPANIKFVDGNEESYFYTKPQPYAVANDDMRRKALCLVPPELQSKYNSQVEIAHTFLIDILYDESPLAISRGGRSVEEMLRLKTRWALDHCDHYVWTWAEAGRIFPVDAKFGAWREKDPLWTDKLQGIYTIFGDELENRISEGSRAQSRLKTDVADGKAKEITSNSNLSLGDQDVPQGWYHWQPDWSRGNHKWLRSVPAVRIQQTIGGSVSQRVELPTVPENDQNDQRRTIHAMARFISCGDAQGALSLTQLNADGKQITTPSLVGETASVEVSLDPKVLEGLHSELPDSYATYEVHHRWELEPETKTIQVIASAVGQGNATDLVFVMNVEAWTIVP
jgi:hypothetical protein